MNPVLRKDLLALLRLRRIAAIEIGFVALLALLLVLDWPQSGVLSLSMGRADNLLLGIMMGQLAVLILAVPGVASVSLTAELEGNTFEMLYASRLSALQIAVGKLLASIAFPLLLMLSALPFVALLSYRGSLDTANLLRSYLVLIVAALLLSLISLLISSFCRQTGTALVIAYLVSLGICVGVLVPAALILQQLEGWSAVAVHGLRALSPIAALLSVLRPQTPGDFTGAAKGNYSSHVLFLVGSIPLMVICVLWLIVRLRKPPAASSFRSAASAAKNKPIGGRNPLFVKDARTSSLRGGSWLLRTFYGLLVLSLLLSLMSLNGGVDQPDLLRYVFEVLLALQLTGIAVVTPSLTSASISGEIEAGTFETLRQSRLSAGQIFWGKLAAALLPALLPLLALLPAYGILIFVNPAYLWYTLATLPVLALATAFCCVAGLACSSAADNSARATVSAYLTVVVVFALPAIIWWAASIGVIDNARLVGWLSMPSPLVVALSIVPSSAGFADAAPVSASFIIAPHLYLIAALCIVLLAATRWRLAYLIKRG